MMPISSVRNRDTQTAIIERAARKNIIGPYTIWYGAHARHAYSVQVGDVAIHGPVLDGCLLSAVAIQRGLWPGNELIRADDLLTAARQPKRTC